MASFSDRLLFVLHLLSLVGRSRQRAENPSFKEDKMAIVAYMRELKKPIVCRTGLNSPLRPVLGMYSLLFLTEIVLRYKPL